MKLVLALGVAFLFSNDRIINADKKVFIIVFILWICRMCQSLLVLVLLVHILLKFTMF
jgi:hypothetical protein